MPAALAKRGAPLYRDARFSRCGTYRYLLTRGWAQRGPRICWIMLNPSTADAEVDDPTIRRCIGFSRRWGAASLVVVNLFAYRATAPAELLEASRPAGPQNASQVRAAMASADRIVCAWGAHPAVGRSRLVARLFDSGFALSCLGLTACGAPRHPLYVPYGTRRRSFRRAVSGPGGA